MSFGTIECKFLHVLQHISGHSQSRFLANLTTYQPIIGRPRFQLPTYFETPPSAFRSASPSLDASKTLSSSSFLTTKYFYIYQIFSTASTEERLINSYLVFLRYPLFNSSMYFRNLSPASFQLGAVVFLMKHPANFHFESTLI